MTKQTFTQKQTGDTLSANEWNNLTSYVNTAVDAINAGGSGLPSGSSSEYVSLSSKGSVLITSPKNINIEPAYDGTTYGDISLKPGDDIELLSHHRAADKLDEISVKVHNGDKQPVKLQLNAAEITLTTKDKVGENANVFDINVNSDKNVKGYLKVRAQAIDLRSESHGGIALQPKGKDNDGFENKVKFEHGGGDGLEFGTFNTEHTSLFTDDYRFNKDGKIRLATRFTEPSDKADSNDPTTAFKYIKNNATNNAAKSAETGITYREADDFYDFIDDNAMSAKWEDVVNVANGVFGEIEDGIKVQYKYTKKGNTKACDTISVVAMNNHPSNDFVIEGNTVAPGQTATIASCSLLDMIKLVNYMKTNNQGPWAN